MSVVAETDPFLLAASGRPAPYTPVWFMRQAGRSLPEYRAIRGSGSILDAIKNPRLAADITIQPVTRYGVDAAVLYSDIVVPAHAIGFGIDVAPGTGPVAENPLRTRGDVARLRPYEPDLDAPYVGKTVDILARELSVPILAFAGAPFTVGSYLIEGRPSRTHEITRSLMTQETAVWHDVMERLAGHAIESISSQVEHGARAFQLFDSWAGSLTVQEYRSYVLPHSKRIFDELHDRFPRVAGIHFGVGCDHLLEAIHESGCDVVGLDWRSRISDARRRLGDELIVQGNMDPVAVLGDIDSALAAADNVLEDNAGHPGHIFNLGHGVKPEANPDALAAVVKHVHERTKREAS